MNPEIKAKWVAALRSGEYKQGYQQLYQQLYTSDTDSYCCLGVLEKIARPRKIIRGFNLTIETCKLVGLDANPIVNIDGYTETLSFVNDEVGLDFSQIADLIEAQL